MAIALALQSAQKTLDEAMVGITASQEWRQVEEGLLRRPAIVHFLTRRRGDRALSGGQGRRNIRAISRFWHQVEIQRAAMLEIIIDLLPAPLPGMMFAHQGRGGVNGALIVRVLSISIETLSQIRTVERHLTQGVGRQKRIVFAALGYGAEDARPSR